MSWNAHVWLKFDNVKDDFNWNWFSEWSNVKRVWSTTGDWDCFLEVNGDSLESVEDFVWKKLRTQSWIKETRSSFSREVWNANS